MGEIKYIEKLKAIGVLVLAFCFFQANFYFSSPIFTRNNWFDVEEYK